MRISTEMQFILDDLNRVERKSMSRLSDLSVNDLGIGLIELYYKRDSLLTRELIRDFLSRAGAVWLRKLLTKDTTPIASSATRFASLSDYVGLLAANDASSDLVSNA